MFSFYVYKTQLLKRDTVSFVDLRGQVNSVGYVRDVTNRCENCAVGGAGERRGSVGCRRVDCVIRHGYSHAPPLHEKADILIKVAH